MKLKILGLSLISCFVLSGCSYKVVENKQDYVKIKTQELDYKFNVREDSNSRVLDKSITKEVNKDILVRLNNTGSKLVEKNTKEVRVGKDVKMSYERKINPSNEKEEILIVNLDVTIYDYDEKNNIETSKSYPFYQVLTKNTRDDKNESIWVFEE